MNRAQYASNTWANATRDEETMMGKIGSDVDALTTGFINGQDNNQEEEPLDCAYLLEYGEHNFEDRSGICQSCGYHCKHDEYVFEGSDGSTMCTKCGMICSHTFHNGRCDNCGVTCVEIQEQYGSGGWSKNGHGFYYDLKASEGRCICGEAVCDHHGNGNNSCWRGDDYYCECYGCGAIINHVFEDDQCIYCGSYDPNYDPGS